MMDGCYMMVNGNEWMAGVDNYQKNVDLLGSRTLLGKILFTDGGNEGERMGGGDGENRRSGGGESSGSRRRRRRRRRSKGDQWWFYLGNE